MAGVLCRLLRVATAVPRGALWLARKAVGE